MYMISGSHITEALDAECLLLKRKVSEKARGHVPKPSMKKWEKQKAEVKHKTAGPHFRCADVTYDWEINTFSLRSTNMYQWLCPDPWCLARQSFTMNRYA